MLTRTPEQIALVEASRLCQEFVDLTRDAIEQTSGWPGISGVFTMTPEDHSGLTKEALMMVTVDTGQWKVIEGS